MGVPHTPTRLELCPGQFQRVVNRILQGPIDEGWCFVYIDDILIASDNEDEHIQHLKRVLQLLQDAKMHASLKKCQFLQPQLEFLGHIVSAQGIAMDPAKVSAMRNFHRPLTLQGVQRFLGMVNYYGRFIDKFMRIAAPLSDLLKQQPCNKIPLLYTVDVDGMAIDSVDPIKHRVRHKGKVIECNKPVWDRRCHDAFVKLKEALCAAPVLAHPDFQGEWELHTDSSEVAIAGILS